ncbi:MAG: hypothetical protein AAB403_18610 [Planctomycetota bacterium]
MDTATHVAVDRPRPQLRAVEEAQSLKVSVVYGLSESGRKASLLTGGDGRARQQLSIQVPPTRMHLVAVDPAGVARLKLQPRYELTESERVVRHEGPPVYDAPPSIDDLYRDAARNHELERLFFAQRQAWRGQRREADRERRVTAAREFLANPAHRAMVHPAPTPKRCFVQTASGRVMFDVTSDLGMAKELPLEAYRRFRNDLHARRQQNLTLRAEQERLHEQKKAAADAWVADHGTADQRSRAAAGLLALDEVVASMTVDAFRAAADIPFYERDGVARLQEHLRNVTGDMDLVVALADLDVSSTDASSATAEQWQLVSRLQAKFPDAQVKVREHRLMSRRHPTMAPLVLFGILVTRRVGPFSLRREFAAPGR